MRFKKMLQAREDFAKGIISEEEYRDIMEDCDFSEIKQETEECENEYEDYLGE